MRRTLLATRQRHDNPKATAAATGTLDAPASDEVPAVEEDREVRPGRAFLIRRRLESSTLLRLAGVSVLLWISPGCAFDTSGSAPAEYAASCSATVRGLGGEGTEFTVTSSDPEFVDHLLATWCAPGPGTNEERVRREWEGHLADTLTADFRSRPGPWCVLEGSSSCELGHPVDDSETCPPPVSGATLGFCPDPPAPQCVLVDPLLDFGSVEVGTSRVLPLEISNICAEAIDVRVGETILGSEADEFKISDNRCPPLPGDSFRSLAPAGSPGDRCDVDVAFLPISPLTRSAEYYFTEAPATTVLVQLRGEGLGARAAVTPDWLCFDPPLSGPDQCTAPGEYVITNPGPGGIRVVDGVLDPAGTGFRDIAPTPSPDSFLARNSTATVRVEWCRALASGLTEEAEYSLTLTTDTAANDTFHLRMETPCP